MELRDELAERILVSDDTRIKIGCYSYGKPKAFIWHVDERIEIGKFCSLSDSVLIFSGGEHNIDWVTTYPLRYAFKDPQAGKDGHPTSKGPVIIGNDVWIGYGVIIVSGVTIGDGAVIGSGSIVSKDIPPYAIAVGNPAKVIKNRFTDEQISNLLKIRWWDWSIDKIKEAIPYLCSSNIDEFIEFSKKYSGSTK